MHTFHFQEAESLKDERISDEEARQVVALWAQQQREQEQRAAQPTVQAMAEGLDIPAEEVLRLLAMVRASESGQQVQHTAAVRRRAHRSGARQLAIVISAIVAILLIVLMNLPQSRQPATISTMPGESYVRQADGSVTMSGPAWDYMKGADGSVTLHTPQGDYEYHADGSLIITRPEGRYARQADGSVEISGPGGSYVRRADGSVEQQGTPPTITPPTPPPGVSLPAVP